MKTEKNKNVAYESPVMETVELVLEESVLQITSGGAGGGTDFGDTESGD